jgi:hypothetical protein
MRIDHYSKAMLTVIAACLVWIALSSRPVWQVVHAQVSKRPFPTIIKSPDFGYRVDGWKGPDSAPIGTLLVQIEGTWYEAHLNPTNK